jgi:alanine transaminase
LRKAQYAVRGKIVVRANEIEQELKQGKKFDFDSLVYCNIGNPQVSSLIPSLVVATPSEAIDFCATGSFAYDLP